MSEEKEETYFQSSKKRPPKNYLGGYVKYCCIPGCKSATKDFNMENTGISLFQIPSTEPHRTTWIRAIQTVRRKGPNDTFDPKNKKHTYVCEFHFKAEDIQVSFGIGRKRPIDKRPPTLFKCVEEELKPKRRSPKKRLPPIIESSESEVLSDLESDEYADDVVDNEDFETIEMTELELLRRENEELKKQVSSLQSSNTNLHQNISDYECKSYRYENISKNNEHFTKATGITKEKFRILLEYINPGKESCNIKYYDTNKRLCEETFTRETEKLKPGRKPLLEPEEQFFLYLSWLKNGFSLIHISWLFDISISTTSRYIITWSNMCYFALGSIPIWPSRDQVDKSMPESFKNTYPSTRCIIDCTEMYCQRPSSLATQSVLYSQYKSHVTYNGLLGIAPSGAITFVSQLFDGSISDKEIVRKSGFLQKYLWDAGDSVMADRGFLIEDDLKQFGVNLNIPAFLDGREQFTAAELKESQTIASVRIHVERAIQRVKNFKILRNEIPLTLHGSINQIWTTCCILCNFMPALIKETPIVNT